MRVIFKASGVALLLAALLAASGCGRAPSFAEGLYEQRNELAEQQLWPGFDAAEIPLALYDGANTWLFGIDPPPRPFQRLKQGVAVVPGRHPAVDANSWTRIDGKLISGVMLPDTSAGEERRLAGLLLHEAFHVFQQTARPGGWSENSVTLAIYPLDDREQLELRRGEEYALRQALLHGASRPDEAKRWARLALELREQRVQLQSAEIARFDALLELNEGTAQYVEWVATGRKPVDVLPDSFYAAGAVRARGYGVGAAWALLLDALAAPGWKGQVQPGDETAEALAAELPAPWSEQERVELMPLHLLLERSLATEPGPAAELAEQDRATIELLSARDLQRLARKRAALHEQVVNRQGWRMVLETEGDDALNVASFDPMNIIALSGDMVLHQRMLTLQHPSGSLTMIGRDALSLAAGDHPLWSGIRAAFFTGIEEEPMIEIRGDSTLVSFAGTRAAFADAHVEVEGMNVMLVVR